MKHISRFTFLLCLPLLAHAERLPVESFGHLPVVDMPSVTPDGRYVAAVLHSDDGPTIAVGEFGSRELDAIVRLKYGEDRIEYIEWANNDRLLVSVSKAERGGRTPFRVSRLYQVGRDGSDMKQIRRKEVGGLYARDRYIDTDTVLSMLPDDPEHILMELWDSRDNGFAVFRVNLEKNSFEKLFANTYDVDRWYVDGTGKVVLGIERFQNRLTTWYRPGDGNKWEVLDERELFESDSFNVIEGDEAIVLSDRETRYDSAWRYDLKAGEFGELIFSPQDHDISSAILSNDRTRVIGFSWLDHYREDHYTDPAAAKTYETIKTSLQGYSTYIASASDDMQKLIVVAQRDNAAPKYIWMDLTRPAGGAWFAQYPYLEGKTLATKTPFAFETSDGTRVEGYLTLPTEPTSEKPSLVVLPHGGPWSRDTQSFDPWVQFIANRGHAVLQVNFRGSRGFGSNFEVAGYKEFGQAMQKDVYDAIDWLESQGTVDTSNACVVGFSYGGYVALTAAWQQPKRFRCIASFAGIADLYQMVRSESMHTATKLVHAQMIGDIGNDADAAMLREQSPVNHVREMKAPILLIHGTEDTRVGVDQSRDFEVKAKQAGLDVEYIEIEDGTHFLDEHHNRLTVFKALDAFLDKHL